MAKNRSIQTFEKRRRERDKQMKHHAKLEERHTRKAQKRAAKLEAEVRGNGPAPAPVPTPTGQAPGVQRPAVPMPTNAQIGTPTSTPMHAPMRVVPAPAPAGNHAPLSAPVPAHIQAPVPKRAIPDLVTAPVEVKP